MTLATCPVQLLSISQVEDVATGFAVLWEHGLETQSNTGASGAAVSYTHLTLPTNREV